MTSTTHPSGPRLRSYDEIVAAEQDIALRIVHFEPTDKLIGWVTEYEEKAPTIEEPTRARMVRLATLGREELEKRGVELGR